MSLSHFPEGQARALSGVHGSQTTAKPLNKPSKFNLQSPIKPQSLSMEMQQRSATWDLDGTHEETRAAQTTASSAQTHNEGMHAHTASCLHRA